MEIISLSGLILIISVCIIAFLMGYFISGGREDNKRLGKELEETKNELKNYRSEVTSHFQETAHKVNALTENYREVYEHLARGAQSLCDKNDAPELMNELNRNPILGGETIENSEVDHEIIPAEAESEISSAPDSEPETTDESQDNTKDTTAVEDQIKSSDGEDDRGGDSVESPEVDENIGEATDSDKTNSDEPLIAANERMKKPEQ